MPQVPPVDQLVVAISSRALIDFEKRPKVFETADNRAYMQMQLERIKQAAKPGVSYCLVRKLLAFNADAVKRGVLTRGQPPFGYLEAPKGIRPQPQTF